jgi:hypothetical protein
MLALRSCALHIATFAWTAATNIKGNFISKLDGLEVTLVVELRAPIPCIACVGDMRSNLVSKLGNVAGTS